MTLDESRSIIEQQLSELREDARLARENHEFAAAREIMQCIALVEKHAWWLRAAVAVVQ